MALTPLLALTIGSAIGAGSSFVASKVASPKIPKPQEAPQLDPTLLAPPPTTNDSPAANDRKVSVAAKQERKRAQGAVGRSDTILTSPKGLGELGEGNKQTKTLLGY
jgi:hypothetical protein